MSGEEKWFDIQDVEPFLVEYTEFSKFDGKVYAEFGELVDPTYAAYLTARILIDMNASLHRIANALEAKNNE